MFIQDWRHKVLFLFHLYEAAWHSRNIHILLVIKQSIPFTKPPQTWLRLQGHSCRSSRNLSSQGIKLNPSDPSPKAAENNVASIRMIPLNTGLGQFVRKQIKLNYQIASNDSLMTSTQGIMGNRDYKSYIGCPVSQWPKRQLNFLPKENGFRWTSMTSLINSSKF